MKFLQATLDGYLSFRYETTIQFDGLSMVAVTGANGDGKSAAMSCIPWILFGEPRVGKDRDSVINDHQEQATGVLDMEDNEGVRWRVSRTKVWKGQQKLDVHHWDEAEGGWIRFSDHRIDSAQDKIYDIMGGLNADSFYSLCMMKQESGSRFVKASSDDRIAIFMSLLPELEDWAYYENAAANRLRTTNREIERLDNLVDTLDGNEKSQLDTLHQLEASILDFDDKAVIEGDISKLETTAQELRSTIESSSEGRSDLVTKLKMLQSSRRVHNAEIGEKRFGLQSQLKAIRSLGDRVDRAESKLESISKRSTKNSDELVEIHKDLVEIDREMDEHTARLPEYKDELESASKDESSIDSSLSEIRAQIEAMEIQHDHEEKGRCILCDSELLPEKLAELIQAAQSNLEERTIQHSAALDRVETAKKGINRLDSKTRRLRSERADLTSGQQKFTNELSSFASQVEELEETLSELVAELDGYPSVESIEGRVLELVDEPESGDESVLRSEIDSIDSDNPLAEKLTQAEKQLVRKRESIQEIARIGGKIESAQERLVTIKKERSESKVSLSTLNQERESLEWTKKACSQKGVPSMLIGEILQQIEERQNQLLERLMGERAVRVEFRQQRELKTREGHKDVLDIIVLTHDGWERPIESFSGGEQIRLTFSNIFAMIQVFNERRPGLIDNLFLDEPLGPLDMERTPIVLDIIRDALSHGIVSSVFMSTHDPMVIDAMPQRIIVSRDPSRDNTTMLEVA